MVALQKEVLDASSFRGVWSMVYGNPLVEEIRTRGGVHPDQIVNALSRGATSRVRRSQSDAAPGHPVEASRP